MKTILAFVKKKIDQLIADPKLSQIELMRKQVAFSWTVGSFISIIVLTILAYIINANIIGHFGVVLIVYCAFMIPLFRMHNYDIYQAVFLALIIITAFIFILIFGGYANSAGLVFVGLTCVISSILNKSVRVSFFVFFLYIGTILGLAVLNPHLTPHPDITPKINFIFFIINTIWMSAAMMFFIIEYITQRNQYQLNETKRLQELDEAKTQLFTNITHEFRTPITLISGLADQICHDDLQTSRAVAQIKKQSKNLLNLVNQILDLAKIDAKAIQTHYVNADIIGYLKYLFESFHSAADSKGISIESRIDIDKLEMDFDAEKLEAIVINLISNAIKFTRAGGWIFLGVNKTREDFLEITVQDSGIGIPNEEIEHIFKRFYQVKTDKYQEGNGIGLNLVREFVNQMNGYVEVESEAGKGSTFMVKFPITNKALKQAIHLEKEHFTQTQHVGKPKEIQEESLPLLLIIDDHADMIEYLTSLLEPEYRIRIANHGREGFNLALENIPDIIISDVMMPEMDGFEFLKKIKAEFRTSHIPVLLLTAKADHASKLEGLELGAEAYLFKPFDKGELFIRLRKLLDLRKTLQERFRQENLFQQEIMRSGDIEDEFMNKIHQIINDHLDDESFNISMLCREMAMSHTQLYRKFAALTNDTVNKYIRQYRLHKAMNLLKTTELNVSQIAVEVGLPNLAYFSRIFRDEYNTSPTKIRQTKSIKERDAK